MRNNCKYYLVSSTCNYTYVLLHRHNNFVSCFSCHNEIFVNLVTRVHYSFWNNVVIYFFRNKNNSSIFFLSLYFYNFSIVPVNTCTNCVSVTNSDDIVCLDNNSSNSFIVQVCSFVLTGNYILSKRNRDSCINECY